MAAIDRSREGRRPFRKFENLREITFAAAVPFILPRRATAANRMRGKSISTNTTSENIIHNEAGVPISQREGERERELELEVHADILL